MAIEKLKLRFVETVKEDGQYGDGGGLWLVVSKQGRAKSWVFRYHTDKGERRMGLGSFETIRLVDARERARLCRKQRDEGIDPIDARAKDRIDLKLAATKHKTIDEVFFEWLDNKKSPEVEAATAAMIRRRWEIHVPQATRKLPVQKFSVNDPLNSAVHLLEKILKPLWQEKNFTGQMLLLDFRAVLSYASAKGYITGDNVARQGGPLELTLPSTKNYAEDHHQALPYQEIGKFMAALRSTGFPAMAPTREPTNCIVCKSPHVREIAEARFKGASTENLGRRFGFPRGTIGNHLWCHVGRPFTRDVTGYALEFMILTAVRREQAATARWDEINFGERKWTCSKHKTVKQTKKPHEVMLSKQAMAILERMKELQAVNGFKSEFVFDTGLRGRFAGQGLKRDSLTKYLVRTMGRKDITVHGFRTTFGSWALDTGQDDTAREMALGHQVGNAISQIYTRQGDKLEARRLLMEAWAGYCDRTEPLPTSIIPFRQPKQEAAS
jgi:integrase